MKNLDQDDLDFAALAHASAPDPPTSPTPNDIDFQAIATKKKPGPKPGSHNRPKSPPIYNIYNESTVNGDIDNIPVLQNNSIKESKLDKNTSILAQEAKFLELLFNSSKNKNGYKQTIDNAMILAGYGNLPQTTRYDYARKIMKKYDSCTPEARQIFQDLNFGRLQVAQGLIDKAENAKSEMVSLNALTFAARCQGMTDEKRDQTQGINIIINTAPAPAPAGPDIPPSPIQVVIAGESEAGPKPKQPLRITR